MQTSRFKRLLIVVVTSALCALTTSCGGGVSGDSAWDASAASWDQLTWQ